jgi:hypothetical protein
MMNENVKIEFHPRARDPDVEFSRHRAKKVAEDAFASAFAVFEQQLRLAHTTIAELNQEVERLMALLEERRAKQRDKKRRQRERE